MRVDTRKATALLVYMVAEQPILTRPSVIGLLWPDLTESGARGALRRTLSVLRRGLAGALVTDGDTITLAPSVAISLDDAELAAIEQTHDHDDPCPQCRRQLQAAIQLVGGEFMEGFSLRDAPEFEIWQLQRAEQVRRRVGGLLARLAWAHAVEGDYGSAIDTAQRRVDATPLDEGAWCSLMRLQAWSGRRSAAMGVYRRCVEILDRELGVAPLDTTTELMEAIADEDLPPAPHLRRASAIPPAEDDGDLSEQVAEALAVIGTPATIGELRDLSGRAEAEVVTVVDGMLRDGELVEPSDGWFTFAGTQRREEISAITSMARRRILHNRAADVVRRRPTPDQAALAYHLERAGRLAEAAAEWLAAARSAMSNHRPQEAARHLDAALATGEGDVVAAAHELVGDLHGLAGRYGPALSAYHRAASHRPSGELEAKIATVYARTGRWKLAEHHFGLAVEGSTGEAAAAVLLDLGVVLARTGRLEEADQLRARALTIAPADRRMLAHAAYLSGMIEHGRGHIDLAEERLRQALSMAARHADGTLAAAASGNLGRMLAESGDLDEALAAAEHTVELTRDIGDRHAEAVATANLGDVLQKAGRTEEAAAAVSASVALLAEIGIDDDRLDPEIWKLTGW